MIKMAIIATKVKGFQNITQDKRKVASHVAVIANIALDDVIIAVYRM